MSINRRVVLIVEDNPYDYALLDDYLANDAEYAYSTLHAAGGEEALELMRRETPDCLLLDYHLPDMDGLNLFNVLKAPDGALPAPVIMVTGEDQVALAVSAMKQGVTDYLCKSAITQASLLRAIDNAIEKYRLQRQVAAQQEELALRYEDLAVINRALHDSEKRYESMVANVPGMIYRVLRNRTRNQSKFLYVSEGSRDLFGVAPEQILADPLLLRRMVHPEESEAYEQAVTIANAQAQSWHWEGRFVLPSGATKIIQGIGNPEPQPNGDLLWNGLMMDVTGHVQAQRKVALLASIVESSADAIISQSLDGITTSWNRAAEQMSGYTAEEIIGKPLPRMLPPTKTRELEEICRRIARGEVVRGYETTRIGKDGTLLEIMLTMSPIKDALGQVSGVSAIAQDIRPRKQADRRIRQQVQRLQALRTIDMAIASSLDLRLTLNILLDQVTSQLHVDSAAIHLLNPNTQFLEYEAGRGFHTDAIQRTYLNIGECCPGRAVLEQRVVSLVDVKAAGAEFARAGLLAQEDFVTCHVAPLILKGRVEGVLEVFHRSPLPGDEDWLSFLEILAGQAAIAIENAALFKDLQRSNVDLQLAYNGTLEGWSRAMDLRDKETEGHSQRVTEGALALAKAMSIGGQELVHLRRGALLHDIGKMGIPDAILLKPGPLTKEEWSIMRKHPVYAYELLSPISFLRPALDIPYCHHEKWDGSGYPRGLKGEQIPLSARIFAVVDVWDALRSDRPYRPGWPKEKVREHIVQGSGTHFDPQVVKAFLSLAM